MIPYLGKEEFHTLRILVVNDVDELSKLLSDLCHLTRCVWVEEDFLQQVIIFVEHALGYLHVALEGGARSILSPCLSSTSRGPSSLPSCQD